MRFRVELTFNPLPQINDSSEERIPPFSLQHSSGVCVCVCGVWIYPWEVPAHVWRCSSGPPSIRETARKHWSASEERETPLWGLLPHEHSLGHRQECHHGSGENQRQNEQRGRQRQIQQVGVDGRSLHALTWESWWNWNKVRTWLGHDTLHRSLKTKHMTSPKDVRTDLCVKRARFTTYPATLGLFLNDLWVVLIIPEKTCWHE